MERQIVHIDISSFAVSVERLKNSQLRNRPVVVAFPDMERSPVYAASAEARQAGIYRGISLQLARKLCRYIVIVPPNHVLYNRAMHAIQKILAQFTPCIEPVGYGHAYLDMTGTTRLFGPTKDAAAKMQREIQSRLRLESTLGLAGNKLVSKIASAVIKPVSLQDVAPGEERKFIAPLKVDYLPNINSKAKQQMLEFNIRFIKQIAEIPLPQLTTAFGRLGLRLHQASLGIDKTPVHTVQHFPNILEEQTLAEDSNDFGCLRRVLHFLVEKGSLRLRQSHRTAKKFSLQIEYSDHKTAFARKKLFTPINVEKELFNSAELLLKKILTRRTRVRKMAIRLFQLAPASKQLSFFTTTSDLKNERLALAVDQIRGKFGGNAVRVAMGAN